MFFQRISRRYEAARCWYEQLLGQRMGSVFGDAVLATAILSC